MKDRRTRALIREMKAMMDTPGVRQNVQKLSETLGCFRWDERSGGPERTPARRGGRRRKDGTGLA